MSAANCCTLLLFATRWQAATRCSKALPASAACQRSHDGSSSSGSSLRSGGSGGSGSSNGGRVLRVGDCRGEDEMANGCCRSSSSVELGC